MADPIVTKESHIPATDHKPDGSERIYSGATVKEPKDGFLLSLAKGFVKTLLAFPLIAGLAFGYAAATVADAMFVHFKKRRGEAYQEHHSSKGLQALKSFFKDRLERVATSTFVDTWCGAVRNVCQFIENGYDVSYHDKQRQFRDDIPQKVSSFMIPDDDDDVQAPTSVRSPTGSQLNRGPRHPNRHQ